MDNGPTGTINNSGSIINYPSGNINNSGALNNIATINNSGTINNNLSGTINNAGMINNYKGTINNLAILSNTGTINNRCATYSGNPPSGNQLNVISCVTTISGTVFTDDNGNGVQNDGELGISNRTIILVDSNGNRLPDKTTDANGSYSFIGISVGQFLVQTSPVPTNHFPSTGFNSYARPMTVSGLSTIVNFPRCKWNIQCNGHIT
jgi:hypothetical protein